MDHGCGRFRDYSTSSKLFMNERSSTGASPHVADRHFATDGGVRPNFLPKCNDEGDLPNERTQISELESENRFCTFRGVQ
jgi:hypothetical protein